jgi:hypothetical protein
MNWIPIHHLRSEELGQVPEDRITGGAVALRPGRSEKLLILLRSRGGLSLLGEFTRRAS